MNMLRHNFRRLMACVCAIAFATLAFAQPSPPKARVDNVTDEYFGHKVVDPYRWMEDLNAPEMAAWMKAQGDYTRAYLDGLPMHGELLDHIGELSRAGVIVSEVTRAGGMYFYYRLAPDDNDHKLCMRDVATGAERV